MIFFVGDINLTDWIFNVGFGIGTKIEKGQNPYKYIERNNKDLWIGNFEGVSSSVSTNKGIYAKAFRIEPYMLRGINHMDFYSLANNHAMEHGSKAFLETVNSLNGAGSKTFGLKEKKSIIFEHNGNKFSISGMCLRIEASNEEPLYWYNPEYKEIEEELSSLPKDAFKILFVHWGNEYINRPSAAQKKFAHWLIDSGFDLIIGMHPHVLQGFEDYKGKRIYYSLGNYVFDMPSEQCKIGALVALDFKMGYPVYSEQYLHIDKEGFPHIVSESTVPLCWRFNFLNSQLHKDDNSEDYHRSISRGYLVYRKANRKQLFFSAFIHPTSFYGVLKDYLKRKF